MAKKMGFKTSVISESEKEDMGLLMLMNQAKRTKNVSKSKIFKELD